MSPWKSDKVELGDVYYLAGLFPQAIAALREAVRLAPDQAIYQAGLGIVLKDGEHNEEAQAIFLALRDKYPTSPVYPQQLGQLQIKLGHTADAVASLEHALKLAPNQANTWQTLGLAHSILGQDEEVRRIYQRLRGLDPKRAESLYQERLLALEEQP
jgi:Flp pilus assembly protein TadD